MIFLPAPFIFPVVFIIRYYRARSAPAKRTFLINYVGAALDLTSVTRFAIVIIRRGRRFCDFQLYHQVRYDI